MKNPDCPECRKLPKDKMCNRCELHYLEWAFVSAKDAYVRHLWFPLSVEVRLSEILELKDSEILELQATAEAAIEDYINKVNEVLDKEKKDG